MSEHSILVLNSGSSSIKFSLFSSTLHLDLLLHGQIEGIAGEHPRLVFSEEEGKNHERELGAVEAGTHEAAIKALAAAISARRGKLDIAAVGHRIVHGGDRFSAPVLLDDYALAYLDTQIPLAPLHLPHNLETVRAVAKVLPVPQVACFDTAFHQGRAVSEQIFGLPYALYESGIKRYGFHGLSYEYIAGALVRIAPDIAQGRVIVAHLGNGASLCALRQGRSVATTMAFSGLDGLAMGTRCGQLDPGVLLYLLRGGASLQALETLLYKQSGLLGISGISADMRDLLRSEDSRARLAVDYFMRRAARETAALATTLSGIDALVFTGGIGEHAPDIRQGIVQRLQWLGLALDKKANQNGEGRISAFDSTASVWVIPTHEELMIARHSRDLLAL